MTTQKKLSSMVTIHEFVKSFPKFEFKQVIYYFLHLWKALVGNMNDGTLALLGKTPGGNLDVLP